MPKGSVHLYSRVDTVYIQYISIMSHCLIGFYVSYIALSCTNSQPTRPCSSKLSVGKDMGDCKVSKAPT